MEHDITMVTPAEDRDRPPVVGVVGEADADVGPAGASSHEDAEARARPSPAYVSVPPDVWALACGIAAVLDETMPPPVRLITRAVDHLGPARARALLRQALTVEAQDGTGDGARGGGGPARPRGAVGGAGQQDLAHVVQARSSDPPSASPRPPRRPSERASGGQPWHEGHGRVPHWERRHLSFNNLSRLAAELHPPSRAVTSRLKPMPTKESDNELCTTGSRQPPSHPRSSRSTGTNSGFGR